MGNNYSGSNDMMVDRMIRAPICSPRVEGAFRAVDRAAYYHKQARDVNPYSDDPWREGSLHISAPCIYARAVDRLQLEPGVSFLNLGSGTGYLSTVVGLLIGPHGINHGVELQADVVEYAKGKLAEFMANSSAIDKFDFSEPVFVHGNCANLNPELKYDRVYLGASCIPEMASFIMNLVKPNGGILVMPYEDSLMCYVRTRATVTRSTKLLRVTFTEMVGRQYEMDKTMIEMPAPEVMKLKELCRIAIRQRLRQRIDLDHPKLLGSDNYNRQTGPRQATRLFLPNFDFERWGLADWYDEEHFAPAWLGLEAARRRLPSPLPSQDGSETENEAHSDDNSDHEAGAISTDLSEGSYSRSSPSSSSTTSDTGQSGDESSAEHLPPVAKRLRSSARRQSEPLASSSSSSSSASSSSSTSPSPSSSSSSSDYSNFQSALSTQESTDSDLGYGLPGRQYRDGACGLWFRDPAASERSGRHGGRFEEYRAQKGASRHERALLRRARQQEAAQVGDEREHRSHSRQPLKQSQRPESTSVPQPLPVSVAQPNQMALSRRLLLATGYNLRLNGTSLSLATANRALQMTMRQPMLIMNELMEESGPPVARQPERAQSLQQRTGASSLEQAPPQPDDQVQHQMSAGPSSGCKRKRVLSDRGDMSSAAADSRRRKQGRSKRYHYRAAARWRNDAAGNGRDSSQTSGRSESESGAVAASRNSRSEIDQGARASHCRRQWQQQCSCQAADSCNDSIKSAPVEERLAAFLSSTSAADIDGASTSGAPDRRSERGAATSNDNVPDEHYGRVCCHRHRLRRHRCCRQRDARRGHQAASRRDHRRSAARRREPMRPLDECQQYRRHMSGHIRQLDLPKELRIYLNYNREFV